MEDDDHCKFCGAYMDPIGCDTRKHVNGGVWCGQCRQGRDALYGAWHTDEIKALRDVFAKQYAEDPIDWDAERNPPPKETKKQEIKRLRKHWYRLWLSDSYQILDHILEDRGIKK